VLSVKTPLWQLPLVTLDVPWSPALSVMRVVEDRLMKHKLRWSCLYKCLQ